MKIKVLARLILVLLATEPGWAAAGQIVLARPDQVAPEWIIGHPESRAGNMIYMVNRDWGNTLAGLQIFQDLLIPGRKLRRFPEGHFINPKLFQWTKENGGGLGFQIRQNENIKFELKGRIDAQDGLVRIAADITNLDAFAWGNGACGVLTLRLGFTPDFADPRGERIFVRDKAGKEIRVLDAMAANAGFFMLPVAAPIGAWQPWIRKRDQTQKHWVDFISNPCLCLAGNLDPKMNTVQANFQLDLNPGQTRHLEATIAFDRMLEPPRPPRDPQEIVLFGKRLDTDPVMTAGFMLGLCLILSLLASALAYLLVLRRRLRS